MEDARLFEFSFPAARRDPFEAINRPLRADHTLDLGRVHTRYISRHGIGIHPNQRALFQSKMAARPVDGARRSTLVWAKIGPNEVRGHLGQSGCSRGPCDYFTAHYRTRASPRLAVHGAIDLVDVQVA